MEVLSRKMRSGCLGELLYDHELALDSESLESLRGKREAWERALESNELGGNVKKMKITIISELKR